MLSIIGMKAMATGPRRSPMSLMTGTWVAHMKLMSMRQAQSMYFNAFGDKCVKPL